MKVIFLEDVRNVASAGDTKEVADGYGRNFLLPRKLAVLANSQASAVVEAQLKKIALKRAQTEAETAELAGKLDGTEVTLKARTGAEGRLYGSITSADIADGLSSSAGLVIDKRKIELEEPIRQLGSYEVTVRFTHDIAAVIKLTVVADEVAEEKEEKKGKAKAKKAEKVEGEVEVAEEKEEKKEKKGKAKAKKAEKVDGEVEVAEEKEEKKEKKGKAKAKKVEKVEEKVEVAEEKEEETEEKGAE